MNISNFYHENDRKYLRHTNTVIIFYIYEIVYRQFTSQYHISKKIYAELQNKIHSQYSQNNLATYQQQIVHYYYMRLVNSQIYLKKKEIPKIKDPSFFYSKKQTIIDLQQQFISINIQILFNQNDRRQLHMPILLQIISMITSLAVVHKYIYIYLYNNIITYQSYRTLFPSNMFQSQAYFLLQSKHRNKSILVNYFKQHHKNFKSLC
eukprot:TRINITY_DN39541_c0_g3_i3.p1 TRINITY_DN39541_c0_g3~~TRINITY_DN39541_c0_g3_i3.p1  ORF type:complete len:207 (+),score=-30.58 TRINITY_DN39541_c0_g3_i3:434-1054(+)